MVDVSPSQLLAAASLTGEEVTFISQLSSSVTITATTISAQASDNSFNDSANGFIAAGFAVGNRVHVTGFTGDLVNNIFSGVIGTLSAGKMTIDGLPGIGIMDDAAGESVTITKWVSRRLPVSALAGVRRLHSHVTPAGTPASNVETDLASYILPGQTLVAEGMGIKITAWGTFAATSRSRTISIYFGATQNPTYTSSSSSTVQWRSELLILRSGASSQTGTAKSGVGIAGANEDTVNRSRAFTAAEAMANDILIRVTGTVGGAAVANDIMLTGLLVELIP